MDLFAHLNNLHVGLDMPYFCDRCSYRTSMYEDMAYHIRQVFQFNFYLNISNFNFLSRYIKIHNIFFVHIVFNPYYYHLYLIPIF
jgi:hypothetical protein